ncbi:desiccation-related protein PCC13-62-like [Argentina anserina]|uniref:desiccation-related protein PCC13-62-like n=1 Tax=Argentina anserina TaxID=57926 RepID=UPI0021764FF6|nr:desiccation-related protein PCC13-62-like [Potentilla anserina]
MSIRSALVLPLAFCLVGISELLLCSGHAANCDPNLIKANDQDRLQFALNLEMLEAEYFLNGALGKGLDEISPELALGGPPPIGAQKANLDPLVRCIIEEFGYQEVGHVRSIIREAGGFPRPLLDISSQNFANLMDRAVGFKLIPPFDPYADTKKFLLAAYTMPYVGENGYVGTIPYLKNMTSRRLAASLLGVEAGQDAVIRDHLYQRAFEKVEPYNLTVADFTNRISKLRNELGMCGIKDEGVIVPEELGAENRTSSNIISADPNSLAYARTPQEILRIVYASGNESLPGGFYPEGANGRIARHFLKLD